MATTLRMYATCQQRQAQAQAHAAAASGLLGHTELCCICHHQLLLQPQGVYKALDCSLLSLIENSMISVWCLNLGLIISCLSFLG